MAYVTQDRVRIDMIRCSDQYILAFSIGEAELAVATRKKDCFLLYILEPDQFRQGSKHCCNNEPKAISKVNMTSK